MESNGKSDTLVRWMVLLLSGFLFSWGSACRRQAGTLLVLWLTP